MIETSQPPDHALLRRAQQGDPDAFCDLIRDEEQRLYRQALTLCGDAALAEDLAQETLFTAWKRIDQFVGRCRLSTWLCGILINLGRNSARKQTPMPVSVLSEKDRTAADDVIGGLVALEATPFESLQDAERARLVQRCLDRLPDKHREVVQLRFFVDDSLDGIAAALDCSVGTVKSRLFNALEKLHAMPELSRLTNPDSLP